LLRAALAVMISRGATDQQAAISTMLADVADAVGDEPAARAHLAAALDLYEGLGGSEAAEVRQRLARYQPGEPSSARQREQDQASS
jgi:hypothetical protein